MKGVDQLLFFGYLGVIISGSPLEKNENFARRGSYIIGSVTLSVSLSLRRSVKL